VADVAAMTGISRNTVSRQFERERGIIVLAHPKTMHKRRYRSIRIPRAIFGRMIQRMTVR
jgi:hypothetical protein